MRCWVRRVIWLLPLVCGAFSGCFEPPILEPFDGASGDGGAAPSDAGDGPLGAGAAGEPAGGGTAGSMAVSGSSPGGKAGSGGGGAAGQGGSAGNLGAGGALVKVTWLELERDSAPGSADVNAELGIEGSFYAYGDACASLEWDAATRCATGKLCDAGLDYENWGVAVGFDFKNTGASGEPPNTKLLWDPRDVGVKGFAWRVTGDAPALQVWVLNMDPSFGVACGAETCEVPGPPDGDDTASLVGQLLLSDLRKDDWGGAGEVYDFDPARVHALQLKLPAIRVNAPTFAFCVEALGVIR